MAMPAEDEEQVRGRGNEGGDDSEGTIVSCFLDDVSGEETTGCVSEDGGEEMGACFGVGGKLSGFEV